jgi:hypothetical protein
MDTPYFPVTKRADSFLSQEAPGLGLNLEVLLV